MFAKRFLSVQPTPLDVETKSDHQLIIVCIDFKKYTKSYGYITREYKEKSSKSAIEQISNFKEHIIAICEKLKKSNPDKPWIIATRENFITDNNHAISSAQKKALNAMLQGVIKIFPNLTVYVTVGTYKEISNDKHSVLKGYFEKYQWLEKSENGKEKSFSNAQARFNLVFKFAPQFSKKIFAYKNVTYIHTHQDNKPQKYSVIKHYPADNDIMAFPFDRRDVVNQISGKKDNYPKIYNIGNISIGSENCIENFKGMLQNEAKERKLTKPLVHFHFSDYAPCNFKTIHSAKYFIQIDSLSGVVAYIVNQQESDYSVTIYQHDMYKTPDHLDIVTPEYPLDFKISNEIQEEIKKFPPLFKNDKMGKEIIVLLQNLEQNIFDELGEDYLKHFEVFLDKLNNLLHEAPSLYSAGIIHHLSAWAKKYINQLGDRPKCVIS